MDKDTGAEKWQADAHRGEVHFVAQGDELGDTVNALVDAVVGLN